MSGTNAAEDEVDALVDEVRAHLVERESAWLEVMQGHRSVSEVAQERKQLGDAEDDVAIAAELFTPMTAAEEAALVDVLLAGQPTRLPARSGSTMRWLAPVLALAAALVLVWMLLPTETTPESRAPLVAYGAIETDGGLVEKRGPEAPPAPRVIYGRSSPFTWVLRPVDRHASGVGARAFGTSESGASQRLAVEPEVDVSGAVRFSGKIEQLGLAPGKWTIAIVVAPAGALPEDGSAIAALEQREDFAVRRVEIVVEP